MVHIHLDQCRSTREILKENYTTAQEQYLISTERQTAGVGRRGNKWINADRALAFSFNTNLNEIPTLTTLEIAVLIAEFYQSQNIQLKWPNDILNPQFEKVGGILIELYEKQALVGIGINYSRINEKFEYSAGYISSIQEELSKEVVDIYNFITSNRMSTTELVSKWNNYCIHLEKEVIISDDNKTITGKFLGIGKQGQARLMTSSGTQEVFTGSLRIHNSI